MNFTQGGQEQPTNRKGSAGEEFEKGKEAIGNMTRKVAANPQVQAATRAAKDGANKAKEAVLGAIGLNGEQRQSQPQMPYQGGKRRRKSRRKKRTKRRRKSRRKKRRTKRRRKSRRRRR